MIFRDHNLGPGDANRYWIFVIFKLLSRARIFLSDKEIISQIYTVISSSIYDYVVLLLWFYTCISFSLMLKNFIPYIIKRLVYLPVFIYLCYKVYLNICRQYIRTSLVAQMVKRLSTMRETWVRSLGWEDPLRRKWQSIPVLLPGKSHGQKSLAGYSPWGHKELDTTEWLHFTLMQYIALYMCVYIYMYI